ncbi:Membrane-bound lytic murein transglycosylase [Trichinella spiralis]|uniref:Membrane-bound lytic murein transglycosylase n=1 Tax=Trichinella spiralis TaxID=6334 RepID=A0ABR3KK81_TRISP
MDFYPKSESNAKTGRDAPTDLANESPQQPVGIKNLNGLDILLKEMQRSTIAVGPERIQSTLLEVDWDFLVSSDVKNV